MIYLEACVCRNVLNALLGPDITDKLTRIKQVGEEKFTSVPTATERAAVAAAEEARHLFTCTLASLGAARSAKGSNSRAKGESFQRPSSLFARRKERERRESTLWPRCQPAASINSPRYV
jgi:hypothetical protein